MRAELDHIIQQLSDVQTGKNWMGSSYQKMLSKVTPEEVFTRPTSGMHSVAELISHLTFWRNEALLKIQNGGGGKTDDDPGNWKDIEALKEKGWQQIQADYDQSLVDLLDLLKQKDDHFLSSTYYDPDFKGDYSFGWLLDGILHHDIYHLGQLGLVIKFLKNRPH